MPVSPVPRETPRSEHARDDGVTLEEDLRVQIAYRKHAEATMRRNESKYQALLENTHDLISVITPEGVMIYQSPSAESILGHPADDLIGQNCFDSLIHPDDRQANREHFASLRDGHAGRLVWEARFRHADGSWRLLECIGSMAPPDAPLLGIVLNSRDVTRREAARSELEERTRQQTALAELSHFALQGLDLYAIYITAAELVANALGVRFTTITEILPEPGKLVIRAGAGSSTNVIGAVVDGWRTIDATGGLANTESIVIDDLTAAAHTKMFAGEHWQARPLSAASVPIFCRGKPFGFLGALSVVFRHFTPREVTFLETMAHLLSAIIEGRQNESALRAVEARYQRIAANTPGVVYQYVLHADGSVSLPFISDGCRALFGVDPEVARQHPDSFYALLSPEGLESMRIAISESARTLEPLHWEGSMRTIAGEVWISERARPERQLNGDIIWDGVIFDLTELKATENALRAAKEEAEKASRVKSDFLSRVSHELRTPLNAILGFGQLLELETLKESQEASVQQILAGGRNLLSLINEILDIAQIERGGGEFQARLIELRPAIDRAMELIQPISQTGGIALANEAPPECTVFADPGRFEQALVNLLANAVKFNHRGGSVRCTAAPAPGERTRVSVIDDGPGVAEEDQRKLFTPFERLDALDRGIEGSGLGLATTKSVIEAMGGVIGFAPTPGSGATFYFDLPANGQAGAQSRY